jgi:hypothetical protein
VRVALILLQNAALFQRFLEALERIIDRLILTNLYLCQWFVASFTVADVDKQDSRPAATLLPSVA